MTLALQLATTPAEPATMRTIAAAPSATAAAATVRPAGTTLDKTTPPFDDMLAAALPQAHPISTPAIRSSPAAPPDTAVSGSLPPADHGIEVAASKRPKPGQASTAWTLHPIDLTPIPMPTPAILNRSPAKARPVDGDGECASGTALSGRTGEAARGPVIALLQPVAATILAAPPARATTPSTGISGKPTSGDRRLPTPVLGASGPAVMLPDAADATVAKVGSAATVATPASAEAAAAKAAPAFAAVIAELSLTTAATRTADATHSGTAPAVDGPLGAAIVPPISSTGFLPGASALMTTTAKPAAVSESPASPVALPPGPQPTARRSVTPPSEPQDAAASPGADGAIFGAARSAPWALPTAAGPALPLLPDRQLPVAASLVAVSSTDAPGEPGFSIDSRLLGPVSAALTPLDAASNRLHVQFTVDRPETAALITGGSDRLDLTLAATGMRLGSLAVAVDARAALAVPQPDPQRPVQQSAQSDASPSAQSAGSQSSMAWSSSGSASQDPTNAGPRDQRRDQPAAASRGVRVPNSPDLSRDRFA